MGCCKRIVTYELKWSYCGKYIVPGHKSTSGFSLLFWHKLKIRLQKRNQNTTTLGEPAQTEGRSRNNVHMRPNFSRDLSITPGYNETFDPPSRIKVCKIILVGNIRSLFQICKSPLPLSPTMTLQVVANDLSCFLNGPLQLIKHRFI